MELYKRDSMKTKSQYKKPSSSFGRPPLRSPSGKPYGARGAGAHSNRNIASPSENGPVKAVKADLIPKDKRVIIGTHSVLEAVRINPKSVEQAWMVKGWESSHELRELGDLLKHRKIEIVIKEAAVLERFHGNQGAVLIAKPLPEFDINDVLSAEEACILVVDGLEDPHNFGAIIRTAWLMGVKGILTPLDRAVGLTPSVHKVACGGVEHVPVLTTTHFGNPLEELKKNGFWVYGLSHKGKTNIYQQKLSKKIVWVIGSEDKGMRSTTEKLCDELVQIPQASVDASYNASVATAIALTETTRQIKYSKI